VQVGLEEKENLTVTWNASITRRSLCVLLAAILALAFVVTLAGDADARLVRRKIGVAKFTDDFKGTLGAPATNKPFQPPDHFSCRPRSHLRDASLRLPVGNDGYICTPAAGAAVISDDGPVPGVVAESFDLNDALVTSVAADLPPGPGLEGTAAPDLIECDWDGHAPATHPGHGAGVGLAEHFNCVYRHNQQTRVFTVNQFVSTTEIEVDDRNPDVQIGPDNPDNLEDLFLPPVGRAVPKAPTAVPAGGDAGGEGWAIWHFGLVLAASGAMVGAVVIVRRRFLHDF
jgi:hypothetical protein